MKVGLMGAAPDTGNLGVTALCFSVVDSIIKRMPDVDLTVFDFGTGKDRFLEYDGRKVELKGAALTKRFYRRRSLTNIRAANLLGGAWNDAARALRSADFVIDMSGGDSFADIYGPWVFRSMTLSKQTVLEAGSPLVLGPQTYGPFHSERSKEIAADIIRRAAMCWSRDRDSYAVLKTLIGDSFDEQRHRQGVDVAFLLPAREPARPLDARVGSWLASVGPGRETPVIGLNVSGLLYNDPVRSKRQYGLNADYRAVIHGLVSKLLDQTDARLVLVPHVDSGPTASGSDVKACESVLEGVEQRYRQRVVNLGGLSDPREAKWVISRFDWFCGTRMHATIAGLSMGVPTTAIAYSPKTRGVFDTCGVADAVIDPRTLDTADVIAGLWHWWQRSDDLTGQMQSAVENVKMHAERQMDDIVDFARRP